MSSEVLTVVMGNYRYAGKHLYKKYICLQYYCRRKMPVFSKYIVLYKELCVIYCTWQHSYQIWDGITNLLSHLYTVVTINVSHITLCISLYGRANQIVISLQLFPPHSLCQITSACDCTVVELFKYRATPPVSSFQHLVKGHKLTSLAASC